MKTSRLDILKFDRRKDSRYFCESREQFEGTQDCRLGGHGAWGNTAGSEQLEIRGQRSDVKGQRSGVKLISDLRLLTSVIDDFNGFNGFPFTAYRLLPFRAVCFH